MMSLYCTSGINDYHKFALTAITVQVLVILFFPPVFSLAIVLTTSLYLRIYCKVTHEVPAMSPSFYKKTV